MVWLRATPFFAFREELAMDTPRDIWHKLDEENLKLHNTLDLLYAMSEAARSDAK